MNWDSVGTLLKVAGSGFQRNGAMKLKELGACRWQDFLLLLLPVLLNVRGCRLTYY